MWSLKTHLGELRDTPLKYHQLELIRGWKRQVLRIAREEMQHLASVLNVLIAVGGAASIDRTNFPTPCRFYGTGRDRPGS